MKVAAITGGGQGIGRAVALHLGRAGYGVSVVDTDREAGEEVVDLLRRDGIAALFVPADVSEAGEVEHWIRETVRELGCPDLLVNNAGIGRRAPFLELAEADFERVVAVNLRGTFLCSQSVARCMVERGTGGAIVNIASTRAFMSEPGTEAYTASKGGIVSLTHAMAVSLGPHGIRVNCISPGWIETRDRQYSRRCEEPLQSERDRSQHPVGRVGRPEDIAEACLFLAESAGFITGQNLIVDGGMTVKMIYEE